MKAYLLIVAAVAVAAVILLPQFLTPGVAVGDINTRVNASGEVADGFADIELTGFFGIQSSEQEIPDFHFQTLFVTERLGQPSGPVTTILPPATLDVDCQAHAEVTVLEREPVPGPHINIVFANSVERPFNLNDLSTTFEFGHLWLFKDTRYELIMEIVVSDCLQTMEPTEVAWTDTFVFTFDGVSQRVDGADQNPYDDNF